MGVITMLLGDIEAGVWYVANASGGGRTLPGECADGNGGEALLDVGGEGSDNGGWPIFENEGILTGARGVGSDGVRCARSQNSPNLPSLICQSSHSASDVNKLYLMLLKNSTSIT